MMFPSSFKAQEVLDKVDLFISTGGDHGQLDPAATVPWGMVKVGPDTDPGNHSGYNFYANKIMGFSHNRIGGAGCNGAGGNLRVLPGLGDYKITSYKIDKKSELASPAFYSVVFENEIKTELTTTNNTAFHRYTFPRSEKAFVKLDLRSSFADLIHFSANRINSQEYAFSISSKNVCNIGRYTMHYYVKFGQPVEKTTNLGGQLIFHFKTDEKEVIELQVTASSISQEDAKEEWDNYGAYLNFEKAYHQGKSEWLEILSRVKVQGEQEHEKLFYTHLYHTLLNPVRLENRKGEFRATNGNVYTSKKYINYGGWSMWDNFRNKFSLYTLIAPKVSSDIANSLVDLYKYGKPLWSGYNEPVPTVRTEHSIVTLLDFHNRGIQDFDAHLAYSSLGAEIGNYKASTPDKNLELAYDYWALAEFARILEKEEDSVLYREKQMSYKSTWRKYFKEMDEEADVMHAKGLYEGTPWQYRWHVQFDIDGLINLFNGRENFTKELEEFFDNDFYNHGNQPDIHVPYLFNFSSKPWLTQKIVNQILTKEMLQNYGTHGKWDTPYKGRIYRAAPKGYIPEMDDDDGTMAAWYVLSSMGLYPVEVGKPQFQISAPIFDKIIIQLDNDRTFKITTKNRSKDNFYIKHIELNGKRFDQLYIDQDDILKGGELIFELTNKPNTQLGITH